MPVVQVYKRSRGFTLVELLVVITIIVLLLSIVMAATMSAFKTGRNAARKGQHEALSTAIAAYKITFNDLPGYFSEFDLEQLAGSDSSDTKTVTGIHNLMISLMGGIVSEGSGNNPRPYRVDSPSGGQLNLNLLNVGKGSEGYGAFYGGSNEEMKYVKLDDAANTDQMMPVLSDLYTGTPLLYFRHAGGSDPVAKTAGNKNRSRAAFIWGSNRRWYDKAPIYTDRGRYDQFSESLIGPKTQGADVEENLAWFVINPATSNLKVSKKANVADNTLKGDYILVNGGEDGIYFSQNNLDPNPPGGRQPRGVIEDVKDLKRFDDVVSGGT